MFRSVGPVGSRRREGVGGRPVARLLDMEGREEEEGNAPYFIVALTAQAETGQADSHIDGSVVSWM